MIEYIIIQSGTGQTVIELRDIRKSIHYRLRAIMGLASLRGSIHSMKRDAINILRDAFCK